MKKEYPRTVYQAEGKGSMSVKLPIRKVMALIRLINTKLKEVDRG